jgi:LysR family glycine cleavage system transcriptional activator
MSVSPPRPGGPSLNALRAFEAAARLGSFATAADELSVTPGAVSQHIRTVEDWAGVALFARLAQGVRLTAAGRDVAASLEGAFDRIHATTRMMRDINPRPALSIAALPSVAQLWLLPRLPGIRNGLPGISLSVHALEAAPDLRRNLYDLSLFIRTPTGNRTEIVLQNDVIFPVCAPEVARRITAAGELDAETLIRDASWHDDWQVWAEQSGVALPPTPSISSHSLYSMAIAETLAGAGVVIGHQCLIGEQLKDGSLVRPFDKSCDTGKALVAEVPDMGRLPDALRRLTNFLRSGVSGCG